MGPKQAAELLVEGAWGVLMRNNELDGAPSRLESCRKLDFDGNNGRSKLLHCDFRAVTSRFFALRNPKQPDSLELFNIHGS